MNSTGRSERCNDIYVGTAGYSYSHWRKGVFYPPSGVTHAQELRYYSGVFSGVEINASFHAVPRAETLANWARTAKPGFVFSFKVPQRITHEKRMEHIDSDLHFFLGRLLKMAEIRPCLGPILFQLPPSLPKDVSKLENISTIIPSTVKVAFEFRHKSWYTQEVYDAMRKYGFGLCDNISPNQSTLRVDNADYDVEAATTAKVWHYIRCHKRGPELITDYTDEQLEKIADQLIQRRKRNIVQYCYFLNDHEGNGPKNAKTLIGFIKERLSNDNTEENGGGLVENWKPDPAAPSISSLFAKASAKAGTTTSPSPTIRKLKTLSPSSSSKRKQTTRSIDSFFYATSVGSSPSKPITKKPKGSGAKQD